MKLILSILLFVAVSISCKGQGYETEKEWIESYKEMVYYNGLLKGLNNKDVIDKLVTIDNSFYNPVFMILHEKAINKGGDYLLELIKKDYMDREGRVAEPASGRRPLLIALKFYQSEQLRNMAKLEYIKWMKLPNRKELIEKARQIY